MSGSEINSKPDIRALMKKRRTSLARRDARRLSARISLRLLGSPYYAEAQHVLLYASFRGEVDTWQLIRRSCAGGKNVYLPKTDPRKRQMLPIPVDWDGESLTNLAEGAYGITEPEGLPVDMDLIDLVCVPALAFDRLGYRVGYGGGYYDRFLGQVSSDTVSVGLAYSFQLLDRLPQEAHDVPLSRLITDSSAINCCLNRRGYSI